MNATLLIFSVLLILVILAISFATPSDSVTISLNSTKVWWNDSVKAAGIAKYANGSGISGTVSLTVDGKTFDCGTTDSNGSWNCTFFAPDEIGSFTVTVNVTNATGSSVLASTLLQVAPSYGKLPIGTASRVVYELPMLMQDLNGKIKIVLARVIVWKG